MTKLSILIFTSKKKYTVWIIIEQLELLHDTNSKSKKDTCKITFHYIRNLLNPTTIETHNVAF